MKQRLLLFLASLMVLLPVFAEDVPMGFATSGNSLSIENVNGEYIITIKGIDPYVATLGLSQTLTDDQNTVKFEYTLSSDLGDGVEFFFSPFLGGREQSFSLIPTNEWTVAQINIENSRKSFGWGKAGDKLRFDFGFPVSAPTSNVVLRVRNFRVGVAEAFVVDDLQQDQSGACLLSSADDLEKYANYINKGYSLDAKLTSDIDYRGRTTFIGATSSFVNVFDGQGHTITLGFDTTADKQALFPNFNGTIRNLRVNGTINARHVRTAGLVVYSNGGYIENCVSEVNIISTASGDAVYGGLVSEHCSNYLYMTNCIFAGKIETTQAYDIGGLMGWSAGQSVVKNCIMAGDISINTGSDCHMFVRNPGNAKITSCVYVQDFGNVKNDLGTKLVSIGQGGLASGELTCKANAVMGGPVFRQNLGSDPTPVPFESHKQVYSAGNVRCDGQPLDDNVTYSNTESTLPGHTYADGVCTVCGLADMSFVPAIDGVYQVGTATQLNWISKYANRGYEVDFVLTNDIDMKDIDFKPIGNTDCKYTGKFDGQGHRISNLAINCPDADGVGLFGVVTGPVEVKNVVLDGSCNITGKRRGGVVGKSAGNSNLLIQNVGNEGNVTMAEDNAGGIYGCNDGSVALVTLRNCYVTGIIKSGREAGALSGWADKAYIEGCWSAAEVTGVDNSGSSVWRGSASQQNNYSTHGQATPITFDDLTSGNLAYMLNGGLKANPVWYQTINMDMHPVLDKTHGLVYKAGDKYGDIHDEATLKVFKDDVVNDARAYADTVMANKQDIEEYIDCIDLLIAATSKEDAISAAFELQSARALVDESAQAYATYKRAVEDAKKFLEDNPGYVGDERDILEEYLYSEDEPNDVYANGGAQYILEACELNTQEIKDELEYLVALKEDMVNNCYQSGTEVTAMLVNPDFSQGLEGWEGLQKLTGTIKSRTVDVYAAEFYGAESLDTYQTLEDVKEGVYVLTANAAARPFGDAESMYYGAELYMNDNAVFVPTVYESRIAVEDAIDGENCYITADATDACPDLEIKDNDGNVVAYAMHGRTSMANAAAAGRAQNYLVTEVTDGTLTIGYRKPACPQGSDWAGLANLHLYYFANMDAAMEYLDKMLEEQTTRATEIANFEIDVTDAVHKPNCPQDVKDALTKAVADVQGAQTAAQKYALVERFSSLNNLFLAGREAYAGLASDLNAVESAANMMMAADKLPDADAVMAAIAEVWEGYKAGNYSTREALNKTALNATGFVPSVKDGVYQIENSKQMCYFASMVNGGGEFLNAKLLGDIDFFTKEQSMNMYRGTFDGGNHTITVDIKTNEKNGAIFARAYNASVKNLVVRGRIETSSQFAGSIFGTTDAGDNNKISNVESYVDIVSTCEGDGTHGGLIGCVNGAVTITNCLFAGSITSTNTNNCGGFAGWASARLEINNSLLIGTFDIVDGNNVTFSRNPGNVVLNNCYYLNALGEVHGSPVQVTVDQIKSGEVCYLLNGQTDINPAWRQNLGADNNPVLDPSHLIVGKAGDGTYANDASSEMGKHNGSKDDPYPLTCIADLRLMRQCMKPGQVTYFVLANDIDMSSVNNWDNLNVFGDVANGKNYTNFINLDGKGHVIKNFSCTGSEYPSFFGVLVGEVRNLGFENANVISTSKGTGILGGYVGHGNYTDAEGNQLTTVLENVWITGEVTCIAERCGVIAGTIGGPVSIKNCYVNAKMTTNLDQTGAIAGRTKAALTVNNFYAAGVAPAGKGLVGINQSAAASTYTNVAVWNNTEKTFGALGANDVTEGVIYYDGTNFAELQQAVVAWDPQIWYCSAEEDAYPVLQFNPTAIESVSATSRNDGVIYNLAGQRVQKMVKGGIYIINGKKYLVR